MRKKNNDFKDVFISRTNIAKYQVQNLLNKYFNNKQNFEKNIHDLIVFLSKLKLNKVVSRSKVSYRFNLFFNNIYSLMKDNNNNKDLVRIALLVYDKVTENNYIKEDVEKISNYDTLKQEIDKIRENLELEHQHNQYLDLEKQTLLSNDKMIQKGIQELLEILKNSQQNNQELDEKKRNTVFYKLVLANNNLNNNLQQEQQQQNNIYIK